MPAANAAQMAETPDLLTLRRNRDDAGRHETPIRRVLLGLLALFLLAGLLNVFGSVRTPRGRRFPTRP